MYKYDFHVGDYAKNTAHLTPMEDIAYRRLIDLYYDTEKPIPLETDLVSRRVRLETDLVLGVLKEFFQQTENGWVHTRCESEIAAYRHRVECAHINGKLGGRPKKTESVNSANPDETGTKANLPPSAFRLPPSAVNQPTSNSTPKNTSPVANAPGPEQQPVKLSAQMKEACRETWEAYRSAYAGKYGTDPVKNQKTASQCIAFCKRVAQDEAPLIAAWYVCHPDQWYGKKMHDFGLLLNDAEKLRTEWATGRTMTQTKARQQERVGAMGSIVAEIAAERAAQ